MTAIQIETGPSSWTLRDERLACTIALADGMLTWRIDGPGGLVTLPAGLGRLVVDEHPVTWEQSESKPRLGWAEFWVRSAPEVLEPLPPAALECT